MDLLFSCAKALGVYNIKEEINNFTQKCAKMSSEDKETWIASTCHAIDQNDAGDVEQLLERFQGKYQEILCDSLDTFLVETSRTGNTKIALFLLCKGANINARNKIDGMSVTNIAYKHRNFSLVYLFCMLGAKPPFPLIEQTIVNRRSLDKKLSQFMSQYLMEYTAFELGIVKFGLISVNSTNFSRALDDMGIHLTFQAPKVPFFVLIRKMKPMFFEANLKIAKEMEVFSDVFDVRTWYFQGGLLQVEISVDKHLSETTQLEVTPLSAAVIQSIQTVFKSNGKPQTVVKVLLRSSKKNNCCFALVTRKVFESFDVMRKSKTIVLNADPRVEILLENNTFTKRDILNIEILDGMDINDITDNQISVLSNALTIKAVKSRQPSKPILITIPLEVDIPVSSDCVLCVVTQERGSNRHVWHKITAVMSEAEFHYIVAEIQQWCSIFVAVKQHHIHQILDDISNVITNEMFPVHFMILRAECVTSTRGHFILVYGRMNQCNTLASSFNTMKRSRRIGPFFLRTHQKLLIECEKFNFSIETRFVSTADNIKCFEMPLNEEAKVLQFKLHVFSSYQKTSMVFKCVPSFCCRKNSVEPGIEMKEHLATIDISL